MVGGLGGVELVGKRGSVRHFNRAYMMKPGEYSDACEKLRHLSPLCARRDTGLTRHMKSTNTLHLTDIYQLHGRSSTLARFWLATGQDNEISLP
jgi:hypothetical protein